MRRRKGEREREDPIERRKRMKKISAALFLNVRAVCQSLKHQVRGRRVGISFLIFFILPLSSPSTSAEYLSHFASDWWTHRERTPSHFDKRSHHIIKDAGQGPKPTKRPEGPVQCIHCGQWCRRQRCWHLLGQLLLPEDEPNAECHPPKAAPFGQR